MKIINDNEINLQNSKLTDDSFELNISESMMIEFALSPQAIQREQIWIDNFKRLCEFKQKYGHLRVPTDLLSAKDYFDEE